MLKVLAHHTLISTLALFALCFYARCGLAQVLSGGQVFTDGLAIIDAPNPGSSFQAGSNMPIAIDVSGNGKLSQNAAIPGSGISTSFDSLEIYLVSSTTDLNVTVSQGGSLLTQESGSTVKHLNFDIPNCVPAGAYNLTFYEVSQINNNPIFAISPIPVQIGNPNPSGSCQTNKLQDQPQICSPAPQSPFITSGQGQQSSIWPGLSMASATAALSATNTPTPGGIETVKTITTAISGSVKTITTTIFYPTPSGLVTVRGSGGLTTIPGFITVTITSAGDYPWPLSSPAPSTAAPTGPPSAVTVTIGNTATPSASPVSITVVVISMETLASTVSGSGGTVTTTVTSTSTTTAVVNGANNPAFLPINAAPQLMIAGTLFLTGVFTTSMMFLTLWSV